MTLAKQAAGKRNRCVSEPNVRRGTELGNNHSHHELFMIGVVMVGNADAGRGRCVQDFLAKIMITKHNKAAMQKRLPFSLRTTRRSGEARCARTQTGTNLVVLHLEQKDERIGLKMYKNRKPRMLCRAPRNWLR